jgi:hypothetical protein
MNATHTFQVNDTVLVNGQPATVLVISDKHRVAKVRPLGSSDTYRVALTRLSAMEK